MWLRRPSRRRERRERRGGVDIARKRITRFFPCLPTDLHLPIPLVAQFKPRESHVKASLPDNPPVGFTTLHKPGSATHSTRAWNGGGSSLPNARAVFLVAPTHGTRTRRAQAPTPSTHKHSARSVAAQVRLRAQTDPLQVRHLDRVLTGARSFHPQGERRYLDNPKKLASRGPP